MATYNFKREAQLFIVTGGNRYSIDIADVSFNQTFREESYPVKTLHAQSNVFEGSVINSAGQANFSFNTPAIVESDYTVIETLLINGSSFDLFVKTETDTFKLETCVITNGEFVIEKSQPLSIGISGQAAKLTRNATLTGSLQNRAATKSYTINPKVEITLAGSSLTDIVSATMELQNEVQWTPYTTINGALSATSASTSMYPSSFVIGKKILSGSISQYLHSTNSTSAQTWDTAASLTIKAGNGLSGSNFRGFSFGPATCSYTNRMNTQNVFIQSYEWRLTDNSTLSNILKYETD